HVRLKHLLYFTFIHISWITIGMVVILADCDDVIMDSVNDVRNHVFTAEAIVTNGHNIELNTFRNWSARLFATRSTVEEFKYKISKLSILFVICHVNNPLRPHPLYAAYWRIFCMTL